MTAFVDAPRTSLDRTQPSKGSGPTAVMVVLSSILAFSLYRLQMAEVWRAGTFFDSDDAMRMVQVRALLGGQHWYDLTAYGLNPPGGVYMHWSRVVDVPIALMIRFFGLFADQATAEALTRLAIPFLYLCGLFSGVAWLADTLFGRLARLPAIAVTTLNGAAVMQFQPGRIDHHAPQIMLLVFVTAAAALALDPRKARWAILSGVLIAVSLAISLENLPFIVCLIGMLVAIWIWRGAPMDRMLRCLSAGLALGLLPFFAATVAPDRWFAPVCDAFGAAHLGAGLIAAAGCAGLAALSARMPRPIHRLGGAGLVALVVLGFVAVAYPTCLHDPFAMVDPLVRDLWLSRVYESQPLLGIARKTPMLALLCVIPPALGLAGCLGGVFIGRGVTSLRFVLLAALTIVGIAMTFWQIRVLGSIVPIAGCGALPLVLGLYEWLKRQGREAVAGLAFCLLLPFTALGWAMVLPDDPAAADSGRNCLAAASFAPLRDLAPGTVVAPIDTGPYLLVHTHLTAFAGPYHRDNDGNRFMYDSFLATPENAHRALAARGAAYVMTCSGLGETKTVAAKAPESLAAALVAGSVPSWLQRITVKDTPFAVYKILPLEK